MTIVQTKFSAEKHGFPFENSFPLPFPIEYPLPLGGNIRLADAVDGLCGGMSFAALDYFYAGQTVPDAAGLTQLDPQFSGYLSSRHLDSLALPVLLKMIEWMLLEDREIAARMARSEVAKLRRLLDQGRPAVLALIRGETSSGGSRNHIVVASGYEWLEPNRDLAVQAYDPNHPGQVVTLSLNRARTSRRLSLSQSSGESLRGFFVIPYRQQAPFLPPAPPIQVFAVSEAVPPFALNWPVDSRRVNQYFGEHPENYHAFGLAGHEGLDLYAISGASVYAAAAGQVYQAGHPPGHPYGLHVRIQHSAADKTYHTIYAHLSKAFVQVGQTVSAGELIGQADNSGNSFGSHLHLTLKIDGAQTRGYPPGIVDPWPYLQGTPLPERKLLPGLSGVSVYTTAQLNLRAGPGTQTEILSILPAGEKLAVLGDPAAVKAKIGQTGQWLLVQTASGQSGFAAAWFLQSTEQQAFPPSDLVVYPFDALNLRSGPGTGFSSLAALAAVDPLTVLGDGAAARAKIGQVDQWLLVETASGVQGFVAAWLVHTTGQVAPASDLRVYAATALNLRARPTTDANVISVIQPGDTLTVLGDRLQEQAKLGQADQWLSVQTGSGYSGWVAAWLVGLTPPAAPPAGETQPALTVYPTAGINIRSQPSVNSPKVDTAAENEPLGVIAADLDAARSKIGQMDAWVYLRKSNGNQGWAAAWYLSLQPD